jgi:hypothetical protein
MKLVKLFIGFIVSMLGIGVIRTLMDRYKFGFYYMDKDEIKEAMDMEAESMDLRGTPTHECICGSRVFNLPVSFYDFEIATYYLDMQCVECGSIYTAPTPLDREKME